MGRPEFQQVITQVPGKSVKVYDFDKKSLSLSAYGSEDTIITSSPNTISRVKSLYLYAGSYSGITGDEHVWTIQPSDLSGGMFYSSKYMSARYDFSKTAEFNYGIFRNTPKTVYPNNNMQTEYMIANGLFFSESVGLNIKYSLNNGGSGAGISQTLQIRLVVLEEQVK